jgi:hypothetical protein
LTIEAEIPQLAKLRFLDDSLISKLRFLDKEEEILSRRLRCLKIAQIPVVIL